MAGWNESRTSAQLKTGATEAETVTAGVDGRRSNAGDDVECMSGKGNQTGIWRPVLNCCRGVRGN